jgi:hypothetical protein
MRRRRIAGACGLLALAAAASLVAYRQTRGTARDRRAILLHVAEMEKAIRAHDQAIWLHVEESDPLMAGDPRQVALRQQMLRDFDTLGHLHGFAMKDVEVEIRADRAWAR